MHCLVVEDQQILLDLLATIVDAFSEITTVSKATTCEQAIAISKDMPVDLAILDLHLPDGDGSELGQGLRLEAAFSPETALPEDLARVWTVGSSRIRKPDHFATLLEQRVIEAWLTSSVPLPGGSDSIVSIPVTEDPEPMQLVVHRDLHQQAVMAGLVAGLIAQHQQQQIRLQSP